MTDLFRTAIPILGLLLLAACLVGLALGEMEMSSDSTEQKILATPTRPDAARQAPMDAIPPLDAAAPARTETATFSLG